MKKGFTLAEVVVGIFILAFLLVTITGVFLGGLSGAKKAEKRITAVNLAESMLDNIILMPYDDVIPGNYPPDPVVTLAAGVFPPIPYPEISVGGGTIYEYRVKVEDVSGSGGKLKKITVKVSVEEGPGEGKTEVTITSLKNN